jgi:two-component system chemotaxis sensor kinase CheA
MSDLPPELRRLFLDEAATRLARLSEELLRLEEHGATEPGLVASVFRDAHTLKGSAGMMGFPDFAEVAHRMEDLLEGVRSGERAPTPALVDALLVAVDGLRENLDAMAAGGPDKEALAALAERVTAMAQGEAVADRARTEPTPAPPPVEQQPPQPQPPQPQPPQPAKAQPRADRHVVRVPVALLDTVTRLTDEAGNAHSRLVSALTERLGPGAALPSELDELAGLLRDLHDHGSRARMVPVGDAAEPLRRAVRDLARSLGKDVRFELVGGETELDRSVLDRLADPLLHLVRNAVDHGVEPPAERVAAGKPEEAVVRLSARPAGSQVVITVSDDGRGVDIGRVQALTGAADEDSALEALFHPGFSTAGKVTSVSGRGVGLDVVSAALDPLRGRVDVRTNPGRGAAFVKTVPLTVAAVVCVVVEVGGQHFALPLDRVVTIAAAAPEHVSMAAVLGLPVRRTPQASLVVTDGERQRRFAVAGVADLRELVIKGLGRVMPPVPVVAGAAIDHAGRVVVVLDTEALLDRASAAPTAAEDAPRTPPAERPPRILVVDDDTVVREAQHVLLARAGYDVRTAFDGADALERLREWPADLVLADVQMPVMDGLAFTQAVRADPELRGTAVIIVTSLGSELDRRRGMEAGADGYLVKTTFTDERLLDAVAGLLGRDR